MQSMSHDAAAAAASGTQIVANGTGGLAAGAAASPSVTGLAPAGIDEISAQASTAFASAGAESLSQLAAAQEQLTQAGAAITTSAGMYSAIDDAASGTLE